MSVLVTGAASGIGRYLAERFNAAIVTRDQPLATLGAISKPYDAVLHCAFNMRRDVGPAQINEYLRDTIDLTEAMVRVPHRAFVILSSIDVYPVGVGICDEDAKLDAFVPRNLYALCKMASEATVSRLATNPLILRVGLLLGPYMRPNNLTRLVRGESGALTLTSDSSFHCVGYADIAALIEHAMTVGLTGTYNAAFCPAVTMAEVAVRFDRKPIYGTFSYQTPQISNERLRRAFPHFDSTSMAAVESFAVSLAASAPTRDH
ncbi:NAD(P)-dependent oxidoreductase [Candidatus Kaiserbacteria bacterium]|nr:NAD(P)-dependent oxidoreductase [Candidatus Kaiserbacteria bacterium]